MAGLKRGKSAFRRASRTRMWVMVLAVVIFLLLCLVVSVTVGLILGKRAEEVDKPKKYDFSFEPYRRGEKTVAAVDAHPFRPGEDVYDFILNDITDLSLCLRDEMGKLTYPSAVSLALGTNGDEATAALREEISAIHKAGGRVCAYFHVTSFAAEDPYLRELQAAYEIALVHEAALAGVDEILLLGLDVTERSIDEIEVFVSKMSYAAADALLGVAMKPVVFEMMEDDIYLAARVQSVCDFVALDLCELSAEAGLPASGSSENELSPLEILLEKNEYYIEAYRLRILLSEDNETLSSLLKECGVKNLQVVAN